MATITFLILFFRILFDQIMLTYFFFLGLPGVNDQQPSQRNATKCAGKSSDDNDDDDVLTMINSIQGLTKENTGQNSKSTVCRKHVER